ncbi:tetratricopeptide repeat protein [Thalassoglobus sp.]|uniref:tetratricopeptide repeat protein n=1 Tax=Thalassoglobus sp. TaxID=2795869 RepID=UPI003AA8F8B5
MVDLRLLGLRRSGLSVGLAAVMFFLFPTIAAADAVGDYNLAVQFYKQQRWKMAGEACEEFINKYPEHVQVPMAHLYWGQSLVHLSDFDAARTQFRAYLSNPKAVSDRPLAMYRLGECSYFLNDAKAAEQELTRFLNEYGDHELAEWAIVYLAHSQFQLNKNKEAIRSFEKSLNDYKDGHLKSEAEYGLARALEVDRQSERAEALYRKIAAESTNPHAGDAQFHFAASLFSQGKYKEADQAFLALTTAQPKHRLVPLAFLNAGYAEYQSREFRNAIQRFEKAAESEDQALTAQYWAALSYKSLGEYAQASKIFQESLLAEPDQPLAENIYFQRGDAELRLGNYELALQLFESVYTQWPEGKYSDDSVHSACEAAFQMGDFKKAEALNELFQSRYADGGLKQVQDLLFGRILMARGDQLEVASPEREAVYQQAAELLKNVVETTKVDETKKLAQFQLARAYERLGDDDTLIAVLSSVVENAPMSQLDYDALLLRANAHLRKKDYDNAILDYEAFLKDATSSKLLQDGYTGLVAAQIAKQDWENVTTNLDRLKEHDPESAERHRLSLAAGDAAYDAKLWPQAESFFQIATAEKSGNEYYLAGLSGLGHALYQQEKFAESAKAFEKLTEAQSDDLKLGTHAWYMLGMAHRQAGETEAALSVYEHALEKYQANTQGADPEALQTIYSLAKGAARVSRDLMKNAIAENYYKAAFERIQALPEIKNAELDKLIYEWADMHYNDQDYTRADELFNLLIEETPTSDLVDDASLILAESLRFSGKQAEAETAFRKLATNKTVDDFVRQRSLVHLVDLDAEAGEWEQVLADCNTLETEFPENTHRLYVRYRTAESLLHLSRASDASAILSELMTQLSGQSKEEKPTWWEDVWLLKAESLLEAKDYQNLTKTVEELNTLSPDSKLVHRAELLVGRALEQQAKFVEARAAYTRAIQSKSGKGTESAAEAQFRIAESLLKEKNYKAALKEFYRVYAAYDSPEYEAAALYQAARCDVSLKNWKGAVQSYRTLIKEFPESQHLEEAKKQLVEIEQVFPDL